ncbi:MAG: extracellular solute-binding protein [bacterium]|nr:extracellular solute-binding protein [bacterium]
MNRSIKRSLALLLILCLALGLGACGKGGDGGSQTKDSAATPAPDFVYAAEYQDIHTESEIDYSPELLCEDGFLLSYREKVGERPILQGVTPEYEGQYDIMEPRLALGGLDGSITPLAAYTPVSPEIDGEDKRDFQTSQTINRVFRNEEGNFVVLESVYTSWSEAPEDIKAEDADYFNYLQSDSAYYLRTLDETGAELSRGKLALENPDNFYAYNAQLDEQGNLVASREGGILAFKPDGSLAYQIDFEGWVYSMAKLKDGRVGVYAYDTSATDYSKAMALRIIDSAAGSFESKTYTLARDVYEVISGGGDYDLYYSSGTHFYGYKLAEESGEMLFDWISCDVNNNALQLVSVREDGVVEGFNGNYDEDADDSSFEYVSVSKVPYDAVPHKESLSMAVMYLDYHTQQAIIDFNRSNEKYRVDVRDYSEYNSEDDYSAGLTKLTTEIMAGNMPDILSVAESIPYRQLAAKGLLEDLYPYIDADEQLSRGDFFPNVLSAMELDGKLYAACAGFAVNTAVGASSVVGDTPGWTYDDYYAALATMPEGCDGFDIGVDRDTMLEACLALDMTDYVDWAAGTCSFDSEDFVKVLDFCKPFPDASYYENYEYTAEDSPANRVAQGKQMLCVATFSSTDFFYMDYDKVFGGQATCIGFPTNKGVGNTLAMLESYAMSSSCHNKEAAWQFLRGFLTEEYQMEGNYLPTNQKTFEKQLEKAMEVEYEKDANGNYLLDENGERIPVSRGSVYDGMETYDIYATTPRQAQMLRDVIASATKMMDYDTSIINIVKEEAAAYFAGQKTAQEVCKLIQSKVNIYINEQK